MRTALLLLLAAPLALAACGGAEASSPAPSTKAAATSPDPAVVSACEAFMARARDCTDSYIPALVDLRTELDVPAGIAESVRTEGRDAIIAQAMTEWADDSQPAALTATCQRVASSIPADQLEAMRAGGEACLAKTTCEEYSVCAIELQRPHMARR